jgi:hypothetical protein
LGSVCSIGVRLIALALLTRMSMPPKRSAACSTAEATESASRTSPTIGSAVPPACSISSAAV